jgi:hypothetical protein
MTQKTIFIASDHRGFALKTRIVAWLKEKGYEPRDLGPDNEQRVDASDFAGAGRRFHALGSRGERRPDLRQRAGHGYDRQSLSPYSRRFVLEQYDGAVGPRT